MRFQGSGRRFQGKNITNSNQFEKYRNNLKQINRDKSLIDILHQNCEQ